MADELEKASRNVKEHRENLTPDQVFQRLAEYAKRNGFTVKPKTDGNASIDRTGAITPGPRQPISHELGHAFMTPEGKTVSGYTNSLARDGARRRYDMYGDRNEIQEEAEIAEDTASVMEPGIARRAGVAPKLVATDWSPNPHDRASYEHAKGPDGSDWDSLDDPKEIHESLLEDARHHLNQVDTGQKKFKRGKAVPGTSVDAKINARGSVRKFETWLTSLQKATPVSRVRLPKPAPAPAPAPQPSAIGQGERELRDGIAPSTPAPVESQSPVPGASLDLMADTPQVQAIDYTPHLIPKAQQDAGYKISALEGPNSTKISFLHPSGRSVGSVHIEHPAHDPDAVTSHRYEISEKITGQAHKVIMDYLARAMRHHLYGPPVPPIKKAEKSKRAAWLGRPVVHEQDSDMLEMNSAIHEFQGKLPRQEAEERAHSEYRREHHLSGAAHHLAGIKVAQAAQQMDEAQKHGTMYALHMRALGHDPHAEVPGEVKSRLKPEDQKLYRFRAHKADLFVLDQKDGLKKHEIRMRDILRKGDLVQFPGNPNPVKPQEQPGVVMDGKPHFQERRTAHMVPKLFDAAAHTPPSKLESPVVNAASAFSARGQHAEAVRDARATRPRPAPLGPQVQKPDATVTALHGTGPAAPGLATMAPRQAWDAMVDGHADPSDLSDDHLLGLLAWNDPDGEWGNLREAPQEHAKLQQGLKDLAQRTGLPEVTPDHLEDLAYDHHDPEVNARARELMRVHSWIGELEHMSTNREGLLANIRSMIEGARPVPRE